MSDDPYMTVEQIAEFFQVSPYTVRTWLKGDEPLMTAMKIGTRWRVRQSEVHRFANEKYGVKQ